MRQVTKIYGLKKVWGIRYEKDLASPTMDNPSGVFTAEMQVASEEIARQAVKNLAPINGRNHRVVWRYVSEWQEV